MDPSTKWSTRRWRRVGWPVGALGSAMMATLVFLINLTILIWISSTLKFERGVAQVFTGDCRQAEQINTWAHFGINVVSTLLLGGSNYCMQILSAPTRKEIDTAHAKKKWLDIGVSSVRNLRNVSTRKVVMWWWLGLSSLPLHLLYNSVVFASLSTNEYDIVLASEAFLNGGSLSAYHEAWIPELKDIQNRARYWDHLEPAECINAYTAKYLNTRRNLVVVVTDSRSSKNTSVQQILHQSFHDSLEVRAHAGSRNFPEWNINYCLSEQVAGKCRVNFILSIMIVVMICNAGKALVMFHIAFCLKDSSLITIGDAVDSFSNNRDQTTREMCLSSKESIRAGESQGCESKIASYYEAAITGYDAVTGIQVQKVGFSRTWKAGPVKYEPRVKGWFSAVSRGRGVACLVLFFCCMVTVIICLIFSIKATDSNYGLNRTALDYIHLGIGAVTPTTVITGWDITSIVGNAVIASVLIANIPQSILSLLYFLFNGVFTSMLLTDEWSDYAHKRKPLRVSDPKPGQRSTYFLQLPYRYAVPFLILSGILHWSVSQSIFLAQVASYSKTGELIDPAAVSTCGYSPFGIALTLIGGTCLALSTVILSARRHKPGIPLAGSCSAAISAACHGGEDVDTTAPLQWGVTSPKGEKVGHCAFSDKDVRRARAGKLYAGVVKTD
ncbi:hypothetical protein EPUS_03101 [Endocarpon pusillum Z07020]|uniref:DUF6536 domain-containing protein n=1 Tax=Endocarpon pusillum (strain Z07020 / HMAS-L-300199) TaxID=1263415 RepID=U1HV97_ENDPU|nr:uncharacterized protein EPUS_03101 [Endocarpon pusillum Z07020]ERF73269.1 hypothetical protein EPUS_03101 [Endocarpon pusillum Z07020]